MFHRYSRFVAAILAGIGTGCDDSSTGPPPTFLVTDTVMVAAPLPQNADLPTALDVFAVADVIGGGRFPEFSEDALHWDFLVRVEGGQLVLMPGAAAGVATLTSAITHPLADETFDGLQEAPGQASFVEDSVIAMQVGQVYSARTRLVALGGGRCSQFAKLQPLRVDVTEGLLEVQLVTNQNCGDPRLVPVE